MPLHPGTTFGSAAVEEVFLPRPPLALALAQVRFPQSPELHSDPVLAQIRDHLKQHYPIMREDKAVGYVMTVAGLVEGPPIERIVRFKDKAETWQFSVGQNFMSLDTTTYTTRSDFITRFEQAIEAAADAASPFALDRIGIRYINRFTGKDLANLQNFIVEPFLGLTSLDLAPASIVHSITQTLLQLDEGAIIAKWGLLPGGTVIDTALAAVATPSWILDVDVYQERKDDFNISQIGRDTRRLADIAYRFFRLAVTDDLIYYAGGQP
jgi:uncharacterized protein (TIGR04255 family)